MTLTKEQSAATENMLSRHSVRAYKPGVTMPEEDLKRILELASSAPSSWNLQHWRYLVIRDEANKQKLLPLTYNQQQVADASVVVILLGDLQANQSAGEVFSKSPEAVRQAMIGQIEGAYTSPQNARDEAIRNASLAGMQLMLAARALGYDTVPMGGYDRGAVIREFGIPERYLPVMIIPIGVAAQPARATERFPLEQIVINERFQ